MTKAAIYFGLALVLASTSIAKAQNTDVDAAVNQAVYREANLILLRQKLDEGQEAVARRDLVSAAKIYDAAVGLVEQIGPNNSPHPCAFNSLRLPAVVGIIVKCRPSLP
jgi:hypothetical protein